MYPLQSSTRAVALDDLLEEVEHPVVTHSDEAAGMAYDARHRIGVVYPRERHQRLLHAPSETTSRVYAGTLDAHRDMEDRYSPPRIPGHDE